MPVIALMVCQSCDARSEAAAPAHRLSVTLCPCGGLRAGSASSGSRPAAWPGGYCPGDLAGERGESCGGARTSWAGGREASEPPAAGNPASSRPRSYPAGRT
jgi:hypothetical protein